MGRAGTCSPNPARFYFDLPRVKSVAGWGQALCFQGRRYQPCCEDGTADSCLMPPVKAVHTTKFLCCAPPKEFQGRSSSAGLSLVPPEQRQALSCLGCARCVCWGNGLERWIWRETKLYAVGRLRVNLRGSSSSSSQLEWGGG